MRFVDAVVYDTGGRLPLERSAAGARMKTRCGKSSKPGLSGTLVEYGMWALLARMCGLWCLLLGGKNMTGARGGACAALGRLRALRQLSSRQSSGMARL